MPVSPGTRLGPYEIVAPLGAGGMGEVWKARDTRLDRSVAIKVLPAGLTGDPHFRSRFEQEAKTISQLNHPHICTLHDVGEEDGTVYLVMELVQGESLADRLGRGPLPMIDVLRYGAQTADALDRAHRAGIVHRDLKPGNVMLGKGGVKLLDFGLAKLAAVPQAKSSPDGSTVVHQKPLTAEGTVVGTIQYMSPEQLGGDAVDARSDIFSLGALLYEMATGTRAFQGSSRTSLIAAIVSGQPRPMAEIQPLTPPAFEHVVSKCLDKDPDQRWQSAHDVSDQLQWTAEQASVAGITASPGVARRRFSSLVPWLIALFAVTVSVFSFWRSRQMPPGRVTKTIISTELEKSRGMAPAISPDGRHVAYPAEGATWIRSLDELEPHKIPVTGGLQPVLFWSPDSRWLAFVSDDKLWKISAAGGSPVLITSLPRGSWFHSGAWGSNDRIVLAKYLGGIYETSARGSTAVEILPVDPGLVDFHSLSFLPDGKTLIAVPHKLANMASIELIRGTKRQTLATFDQVSVGGVAYSNTGHLLISLIGINAGVWALPFSLDRMAATGNQFLVAAGAGACTTSADSSLAYVVNLNYSPEQVLLIDRTGKTIAKIGSVIDGGGAPLLSHDETTLAVSTRDDDNSGSIELMDMSSGNRRRLTHGFLLESPASWSQDDRQLIAFRMPSLNWSDPRYGLWLVPVDSAGEPRKVTSGAWGILTPDDRGLVLMTFDLRGDSRIASVPLTGGTPAQMGKSIHALTMALSPDGRFLTYLTPESGSRELYLTRYPSGEGKWPVSRGMGGRVLWSRDGRTIYFGSNNRLMSASFTDTPSVKIGEPVMLFDATPLNVNLNNGFQILRDGGIIAVQDLPPDKRQVVLVQNWLSEFSDDRSAGH